MNIDRHFKVGYIQRRLSRKKSTYPFQQLIDQSKLQMLNENICSLDRSVLLFYIFYNDDFC